MAMMNPQYTRNTNIGVGAGLVLHALGWWLITHAGPAGALLGPALALAGYAFFIWGCCNYAMGKGYPWPVGLLGLLSCIGLVILVVLPRRS